VTTREICLTRGLLQFDENKILGGEGLDVPGFENNIIGLISKNIENIIFSKFCTCGCIQDRLCFINNPAEVDWKRFRSPKMSQCGQVVNRAMVQSEITMWVAEYSP